MEEKLRNLLDKIYELEGLTHLAIKRQESADEFLRLIVKKGAEVESLCETLTSIDKSQNSISPDDKNSFQINNDLEPQNSDTFVPGFPIDEYSIPEDFSNDLQEKELGGDYDLNKIDNFSNSDAAIKDLMEIDENNDVSSEIIKKNSEKRGKLIFTINERFRFKRELFDNSDVDFNNTLALVASMDDYEEAEDYFINEEGLDMKNPVVKEFLRVIKLYFL